MAAGRYTPAFTLGIVTGARLGDLYGYRRMSLVGVAGFTLASGLCAAAPGAGALVAAPVVQGVFAAAMVPQVLSQIQLTYAPYERGGAPAASSSLNGLASAVGPILGGAALLEADPFGQGRRAVFWLDVPVGVVALVGASRALPEGRAGTGARLDPLGMLLSGAVLVLLLYPLIAGSFAVRAPHPGGRAHSYGFTATMGAGLGLIALRFAVSFLLPRRSAPRSW
ncbi:MFS transporter [Streptomyces sp. NPDC021100]|uniref:MFS transporter n=1 Tax=Streptomyces sp. NPDC021100 TaxID=3365114 RepID=UPI00378A3E39